MWLCLSIQHVVLDCKDLCEQGVVKLSRFDYAHLWQGVHK